MAKPGPPRLPHNKPRGSRGKSGRQFTGRTLARLMRNVDRDVLREAIEIAELQDLFTPTFEKDVRKLLEKSAERDVVLESLAFGTIFLRIFMVIRFIMGLLPQGRITLLVIGLFVVLENSLNKPELPSKDEMLRLADDAGLTDLVTDARQALFDQVQPVLTEVRQAQAHIEDFIFEIRNTTIPALNASEHLATLQLQYKDAGYKVEAQQVLEKIEPLRNLVENSIDVLLPAINKSFADLFAVIENVKAATDLEESKIKRFIDETPSGFLG